MFERRGVCSRMWFVLVCCPFLLLGVRPSGLSAQTAHTGQSPNQHVVLTRDPSIAGGCGLQQSEFFRIFSDGTKASAPFRVPKGWLLVITDVDWWLGDFKSPGSAGTNLYFELALEHQQLPVITTYRVFRDVGTTDSGNRVGRSVSMTTGFVVSPVARICPFAQDADTPDTDLLRLQVILRGYLIKAPRS
jgi:hypothetical protein